MRTPRRIVTGHNASGKSVFLSAEPLEGFNGPIPINVWSNLETPAILDASTETPRRPSYFAPKNGAYFTIVRIDKPTPEELADPDAERKRLQGLFEAIGAAECLPDQTRNPGMHRTSTIDYLVLLSGRLTLMLEEGEVDLEPFDCIVQRGTNHAWVNKYDEPAILCAVMLGATLPD
jgi:mannose-6-phosphate isomerase-like protein (cupin superfamily)